MLKGHFGWCHRVLEAKLLLIGGVTETHFSFYGIMKPFTNFFIRLLFPNLGRNWPQCISIAYYHEQSWVQELSGAQGSKASFIPLVLLSVWFSTSCTVESPKMISQSLWLDWSGQALLVYKSLPGDSNVWSGLRAMCLTGFLSGIL